MERSSLLLLFFCLFAGIAFADAQDGSIVDRYVYEGQTGNVVFHHKKHSERALEDCGFCHSALRTFGGQVNDLFGHNICLKCHEKRGGPTECRQCHAQKS